MQSLLVEITAFLRFLPSPPLDFFSFPRTHDSPETHLHPSRTPPTQRIHKGGFICIQLLASDSLNFLKDKPLRSRNSHDRAREGKVLAIVLSVPERAASKGRLKAPGTRLNGNWGIPERRAKTGALVSTESSSAGRANAGAGREGVDGGLRVDVRCLATHPFSQHPLWTRRHHQRRCHVTNTDYIYIYMPPLLSPPARTSIFHSAPSSPLPFLFLFLFPRRAFLLSFSPSDRILDAASSIIQAPPRCSTTVPFRRFLGFHLSGILCFFPSPFPFFHEQQEGRGILDEYNGREGEFRSDGDSR